VIVRHLPVTPRVEPLTLEAEDLLRSDPSHTTLPHAREVLARSYGVESWARLVLACELIDAIRRDDLDAVRALVQREPTLLHENARAVKTCNWGPPMSYAANLGRDRIIAMLRELGARDLEHAAGRAALQGHVGTARMIYEMAGSPPLPTGAVMGPCETQNPGGLALVLELGAGIHDDRGDRRAPVAMLLETYGRNPTGKHQCLEILAARGIELPDTPTMALHRGRLDLLETHLRRDPALLTRTYSHAEIYPTEVGCHTDESLACHATPLAGATLLHMCVDYGDLETARWLIDKGMNANVRAAVDADGFGGHTPLFSAVVSYAWYVRSKYATPKPEDDPFAELLFDHGADPNVRASLRTSVHDEQGTVHEYRDVTPLAWGERFHARELVSTPAMRLIAERGGRA
jgi:hypothetical protein